MLEIELFWKTRKILGDIKTRKMIKTRKISSHKGIVVYSIHSASFTTTRNPATRNPSVLQCYQHRIPPTFVVEKEKRSHLRIIALFIFLHQNGDLLYFFRNPFLTREKW